jgi:hypothetical protein
MNNLSAFLGLIVDFIAIASAVIAILIYISKRPSRRELFVRSSIIVGVLVPIIVFGLFISTSTNIIVRTPIFPPFVPNATETPTPTPSPTPTPTVIPINQIMSCTNCFTSDNFSLIVKYATFDPAQSQLTLVIGVKNISTVDKGEVQFKYLKLQDTQTGVTADGGGEGFSSFNISVNSQILFRPTFQFVPVTGHKYSLSAELDSFDLGWADHLFSAITITL